MQLPARLAQICFYLPQQITLSHTVICNLRSIVLTVRSREKVAGLIGSRSRAAHRHGRAHPGRKTTRRSWPRSSAWTSSTVDG
jgi:hypothetical protein